MGATCRAPRGRGVACAQCLHPYQNGARTWARAGGPAGQPPVARPPMATWASCTAPQQPRHDPGCRRPRRSYLCRCWWPARCRRSHRLSLSAAAAAASARLQEIAKAFKEGGKKGVDLQVRRSQPGCERLQLEPTQVSHARRRRLRSPRALAAHGPAPACGTAAQGVAAMGGVCFFNLAVETPNGDMALLEKARAGCACVGQTGWPGWLAGLAGCRCWACLPPLAASAAGWRSSSSVHCPPFRLPTSPPQPPAACSAGHGGRQRARGRGR